ncbi:MAG: tetratricopeptide repeat protein [Chitinophagaceae bacterium]|nr:tetratricopeptide repeat protein [Chitinophagaceae bacterium]
MTDPNLHPTRSCRQRATRILLLLALIACSFSRTAARISDIQLREAPLNHSFSLKPDSLYLALKDQYNLAVQERNRSSQGALLEKMGELSFHMGQYAQALEYYLDASQLFRQDNKQNELAYNYIYLGILYYYNRDTTRSNNYFRQALSRFRQQKDRKGLAIAYGNIGFLFEKARLYDSASHYQNLALKEYHTTNDKAGMAKIYENIGSIYEDLSQYDSAMANFRKALQLYKDDDEKILHIEVLNNIGDIYRKTGQYKEALSYSMKATAISRQSNERYQLSSGYRDIAKTYKLLGRDDSAFYYLDLSRKYLLDIYSHESSMQVAFLQAQDDVRKKNREIEKLNNAQRINTVITISVVIIIILLLAIGLIILNRQKLKIKNERSLNKQQKEILETQNRLMQADLKAQVLGEEKLKSELLAQRLEREKLDAELKNKALEETLLKEQIEVKTKELSTNALHVIQKNQLLEQLKTSIGSLVDDEKRDQKKQLRQLLAQINQNFSNEGYWEEFKTTFEQIHQSFFEELKKTCPELSSSELRLVCLLKMNMSSNDMATMLGISTDSLRVARYRLRKKLNLEQGGNLVAFLQNL